MIVSGFQRHSFQCKMQNVARPSSPKSKCKIRRLTILYFSFCIFYFALASQSTAQEPASLVAREEAALRAAAERVSKSVVQIRTIGGLDTVGGTLLADGPTTGLVISADGYIVSSAFNFVQQPASILVTFASGKQAPAELVATDHSRMIVLLKASDVSDLSVPDIVPANEIQVGQWAVALGRTFRADRTNVTVGIVSAMDRIFGKVMQTDADVSVANYGGPLVDIRGRVFGVIVPMSPQATSEVAGVEWYDSGIGFAVPLASISERLEKMKRGEDQRAGILGIGLPPRNPHSSPAELAAVRPDSPAGKAGLKKGDRIVEIDGKPIRTQTDLRFSLGTRYGGDKVKVAFERGGQRQDRELELVGELPAFRHAFLGILPRRPVGAAATSDSSADSKDKSESDRRDQDAAERKDDDDDNHGGDDSSESKSGNQESDPDEAGITVRMVYAGSPADKAGVKAGDRIVRINETPLRSVGEAIAEMNNAAPGNEIALRLVRAGMPTDLRLTASRLPASVPSDLPPAYEAEDDKVTASPENAEKKEQPDDAEGKTLDLKLPEFPQQSRIYWPAMHNQERALGLLLWLHAPGNSNADEVIRDWQAICDRDGLVLVVPDSAEADRWDRTELEYLSRLIERALGMDEHRIEPSRVAVYGEGGGGAMAWLLAISRRDVIRGVATSAAPLPRQIKVPPNEPMQRLAVFVALTSDGDTSVQITQGLQKFSEAGYPVTTLAEGNPSGELTAAERNELARWMDTLDRF